MDDKALIRIKSLLKQINLVLSDTKDIDLTEYTIKSQLVRATCFSISQIGEQMIRLQEKIGDKYPDVPWLGARSMRNMIVHDYDKVDLQQVSKTIKNDLPQLEEVFLKIEKDYEKKTA